MRTRLFLRSFLIQAVWNHRNLLGTGLAWSLGPDRAPTEDDRSAQRPDSAEPDTDWHFNSHPYLAGVAMGALQRMRDHGAPPAEVRRFRLALRGPLGSLGDSLVWVGWLPASLMIAGTALILGVSPVGAALLFLALHNLLHLPLRWWAVGAGLRKGREVALAFQQANLGGLGQQIRGLAVLFSGILLGVLGVLAVAVLDQPFHWLAAAAGMVGLGLWRGLSLPGSFPGILTLGLLILGWLWSVV